MAEQPSLEEAKQLHQDGELEKAISAYSRVIKKDHTNLEARHFLAMAYAQSEQYQQALDSLDKAIAIAPEQPSFYNSKANVLIRMQRTDEAIAALEHAIDCDPSYSTAHNTLGRCYYTIEQLDEAKKHYQRAIELDKHFPQAHYNLALLFLHQEQLDEAIQELQTTLALDPKYAKAYGQLAETYMLQEHYSKAVDSLLQRMELQPQHADSYYTLGIAYLKQQQPEEACSALEQALALECEEQDLQHLLGNAYLHRGDPPKALNYYMRQLEVAPMVEAYYNIGVILMHQERNKEAIQYLQQAISIDPNYLPVFINLGSIYLKLQQLDQAKEQYQKALEIDPNNDELQHILTAITQEGTPDQAPKTYVKNLFDQYALYYDKHLTEVLKFSVPQHLFEAVDEEIAELNNMPDQWTILDVGCGTGLAAPYFKHMAKKLIGVDLSEQMIAIAKSKDLYDELEVMNANEVAQHYQSIDLIIASDVLTYIGNLELLFPIFHQTLSPNGILAFSVESTLEEGYILQTTIRYAHNKKYIEQALQSSGFTQLCCQKHVLRTQQKEPVNGYLVVAQRV
jgi:predicted TPR repeat methyltransferase